MNMNISKIKACQKFTLGLKTGVGPLYYDGDLKNGLVQYSGHGDLHNH